MIKLSGPLLEKFDPRNPIAQDLNSITKNLSKKDSTLWGPAAQAEAQVRLNWIDLPTTSSALLSKLDELTTWISNQNLTTIILCGMGGSSLAPEVFGKSFNKKIITLDSTDPEQISVALKNDLSKSVIIVGSKSGSTVETASQKALFESELKNAGLNPLNHLVIITDPDSPLDIESRSNGYQVVNADPNVGGRFSALSAFGLVPAALMGIDISKFLAEAKVASDSFTNENSTVVQVATLLLTHTEQIVAFSDQGSNVPGLSDWIEQLIAESTGKDGVGRLPVVIESEGAEISGNFPLITFKDGTGQLSVCGSLAEQFIFWEWVTALLGRGLKVDPFNQPNVTEAKERTVSLLSKWNGVIQSPTSSFEDENIAVFADQKCGSLDEALARFLAPNYGYLAVMAYLNREGDNEILKIRELIADKTKTPTTFGWGPRFLHSTGQFHKGGQPNGGFLQISADSSIDIQVPGKNFSFQTLLMAQALGDGEALSSRNLPLLRIHLKNRAVGINKVLEGIKKL
jgi:glucose-6-phosphate isomerase